jgi:retinol dehydrogenase-12
MSEWKFQDVCRAMLSVLYSNIFDTPPYPTTKFTGQTIIVTGSNCGLGREAARHFVRLDAAKVILAVRSMEKGNDAKSSLEASEKRVGVVEVWHLDLGSYASLKNFAAKAQELERLDVVTENAGIKTEKWVMVEDNESQITVNFVSTFLLGLLLLPKLRGTAERYNVVPRLNIVASFVHLNITKFPVAEEDDIFAALVDENRMNIKDMYDLTFKP